MPVLCGEPPFSLVDRVLAVEEGVRAVGLRNVTADDPLLVQGGGAPVAMRRSLVIEAFAELASRALSRAVEVSRIEAMRFNRSPVPGDQLVVIVDVAQKEGGATASCRAEIDGVVVCEGTMELTTEMAQCPDDNSNKMHRMNGMKGEKDKE
jgi:3-hydroxyacyl-[acyl-carrier-protein] dehydratase